MKKNIVWGTCWYNETKESIIKFFDSSLSYLKNCNCNVFPVIFYAKCDNDESDIAFIKSKLKNVIIIKNKTDIFPNKNYGIALITKVSMELNADYTAIVDCDWDIKQSKKFIDNTLFYAIDNDYDLVIPNIGEANGRSNLLIGRPTINLLYPEYKDIIYSAFPGSLVSKTSKLNLIISDYNYHFDWGGEWDIISIAIKNNFKIGSKLVNVKSTRHRSNDSKMYDSFQIWRAILCDDELKNRLKKIKKYKNDIIPYDNFSKLIINNDCSIKELIDEISNGSTNNTQKQLLYMVLYPIAFLVGDIKYIPKIDSFEEPYDNTEIMNVSNLALYCIRQILNKCDIQLMQNRCKNLNNKYLSKWNYNNQKNAMKNYKVI